MKDKSLYTTVTECLQPFSGLDSIAADIVSNAGSRGTVVHMICDAIIFEYPTADDVEYIDKIIRLYTRGDHHFEKEKDIIFKLVESFKKWAEGKKFLKKPKRFFNDDLWLTGECDLLYKNEDGKTVLVDLKTPVSESKTWALQGSAYSYLAKQEGIKVDFIHFVKLSRTGGNAKEYLYEENFPLFKAHLDAYRYSFKGSVPVEVLDYI